MYISSRLNATQSAACTSNNSNIYFQLSKFYKSFKRNLSKSKK
ncbi:hypothetical protein [Brachyspira alvinipulli]|nr:hypothetical protein [Brachyspira alvinipulli]